MFGWLRRRRAVKAAGLSAQHWASYLTLAQQDRLERLALEWFRRRDPGAACDGGMVEAGGRRYGLENLAQRCRALAEDEWPELCRSHFEALAASEEEAAEWEAYGDSFAWAAEQLRVRLYPQDLMGADVMVTREDLPSVLSALVVDRPASIASISLEQVAVWGRPVDELFARALEQTFASEPVELEWVDLAAGEASGPMRIATLFGDSLYASTHALRLAHWPELLGEHGSLVAVPDRHNVLVAPIRDVGVVHVADRLMAVASSMFENGPGSISPDLFWRRQDGSFVAQRVVAPAGSRGPARFCPSPEFVDLLNRLGRPA